MTTISSTSSAKADAYCYLRKAAFIFVGSVAGSAGGLAFLSVVGAILGRDFSRPWLSSTKALYENLGPNSSYFERFQVMTTAFVEYPQALGWTALANGILGANTANAIGDWYEETVLGISQPGKYRLEPSLATQNIITGVACCLIFAFSMKETISIVASNNRNYKIVNLSPIFSRISNGSGGRLVASLSQRVSTAVGEILSLFRRTIAAAIDLAANICCRRQ